jgi:hypothetical protein
MSASNKKRTPEIPNAEEAARSNPKVDVDQLREAQTLLEELRKKGLAGPEYDIPSPYERRPRRVRSSRAGLKRQT